ncbi:hypothetical protein K140096H11_17460 [Bacteroides intestinalis]|uniref:hypothetical protein n=1 Tax=Bacteroides TaxID=816 RepID=UPI00201E64F0|nr:MULTISPECIES: hypothetical protein [Bacteroides]
MNNQLKKRNQYETIEFNPAAVGGDGGIGVRHFLQGDEHRTAGKDAGRLGKHGQ